MSLCKYYKQKRIVSYDSGSTWQDVSPAEYRVGGLYELDSPDCSEGESIIRWVLVPGDYLCEDKDKYEKEIEQYSTDNGQTWLNIYPATYRKGSLIESNSTLCNNKWEGHYITTTEEWQICPTWYKWVDGVGCVYVDPIKIIRCETSSSTTLTFDDIVYNSYPLIYGTIGDCVTSIDGAFYECSGLTSINIPSGVTSIGEESFFYCTGLRSIVIPSGVTSIGFNAFYYCNRLTSIDIPDSVTSIGTSAFDSCYRLTSLTIGSGIINIGREAFYGCDSLTSVTVKAVTPPTLGSSAFAYTNSCPIYVPSGSVETYKSASGWSNYASRITAIP